MPRPTDTRQAQDPDAPGAGHAIRFEVSVATLPEAGMPVRFEAEATELEALTRQLRIDAVESLRAEVLVRRWKGRGVEVTGELVATVVQPCVVTLDPLRQEVREAIETVYVPEGSPLARVPAEGDNVLHVDPEGADIPETFSGDRIDLGALFCETVALGLDPYPRRAGVGLPEEGTAPAEKPPSPFAGLAALRPKGGTEL